MSQEAGARSKAARKKMQKQAPGAWVCGLCTFHNKAAAREKCEMCEEVRNAKRDKSSCDRKQCSASHPMLCIHVIVVLRFPLSTLLLAQSACL